MAYIINKYNGQELTTVQDGTLNTDTELKLVGKNYAGYGEAHNENFLHLMEHFANPIAPGKPVSGMIWFDSATNKIKFYDGTIWRTTGSAEVAETEPASLLEGDLWWNSVTNQLYTKNADDGWTLIGPQTTEFGATQLISRTLIDTVGQPRAIIEAVVSDANSSLETVFLISKDEFTIRSEDLIAGFDVVKRGITLVNTQAVTQGVTVNSGDLNQPIIWGTASNALRLAGVPLADFQLKTEDYNIADDIVIQNVFNLTTDSDDAILQNTQADSNLIFKIQDTVLGTFNNTGLIPGADITFDIGTSSLRWNNIYAANFIGTADQANTVKVGTTYRTSTESVSPGTVAARTSVNETIGGQSISAGSLKANYFVGIATKAQYADLAEKYTTDQEYPIGTVVTICAHNEHESCAANADDICIGVVSEKPAYLMNMNSTGQPIGLVGRLPTRISGAVRKGQPVYALSDGVCSIEKNSSLVGIALETNLDDAEKLVECILKV